MNEIEIFMKEKWIPGFIDIIVNDSEYVKLFPVKKKDSKKFNILLRKVLVEFSAGIEKQRKKMYIEIGKFKPKIITNLN